jgi:SAM-dependent methyltransferase
MTAVSLRHLESLYAGGNDPWQFRTSTYEHAKFQTTRDSLLRTTYASALELGCGNGELARHIAGRCGRYTGVDAVGSALDAARLAVPEGQFVQAFLPCGLPDGRHDLIMLSEVLYFLDRPGVATLGRQIAWRWPGAEVTVVTWLGPSGNTLEGEAALAAFADATSSTFATSLVVRNSDYRIDRFVAS